MTFLTFAGRDIDDVKPDKGKTAIRLKSFLCCFELDSAGSMRILIVDNDN